VPVVFRYLGTRFFFFSNEGNPREPIHVHALRAGAEAKLWVEPDVRVAASTGFSRRELVDLVRVVEERRAIVVKAWHEHFGDFGSV
jgi:hypothetical protein